MRFVVDSLTSFLFCLKNIKKSALHYFKADLSWEKEEEHKMLMKHKELSRVLCILKFML